MTGNVRRVVRQCAECKGVFVDVLAFEQQLANKVSAANVMHKVAEIPAAERIVAEVLNDGAAIGVGVRLFDLVFGKAGIAFQQKRADFVGPHQVHNLFMGQDGIGGRTTATHQHN